MERNDCTFNRPATTHHYSGTDHACKRWTGNFNIQRLICEVTSENRVIKFKVGITAKQMNAQTCNMDWQEYKIVVKDIMDEMINKWSIIWDLMTRNSATKQVTEMVA